MNVIFLISRLFYCASLHKNAKPIFIHLKLMSLATLKFRLSLKVMVSLAGYRRLKNRKFYSQSFA